MENRQNNNELIDTWTVASCITASESPDGRLPARVKCGDCGHEYLLVLQTKTFLPLLSPEAGGGMQAGSGCVKRSSKAFRTDIWSFQHTQNPAFRFYWTHKAGPSIFGPSKKGLLIIDPTQETRSEANFCLRHKDVKEGEEPPDYAVG